MMGAGLMGGGCVKTAPPTQMPPPPPQTAPAPVAADPMARVQTLTRLADTLARTSNELPGESVLIHRQLMVQVFTQFEEILPTLEGPNPGTEFRQQLQTVRDTQAALAAGPENLIANPIIDTGLRASRDALAGITRRGYYDQAKLAPIFDRLAAKLNELDTVGGPLHQLVVGESVGLLSQIVTGMTDTFARQLATTSPAAAR